MTDPALSVKCGAPHFTLFDGLAIMQIDGLPTSASRLL
jgi:hypothetical protein